MQKKAERPLYQVQLMGEFGWRDDPIPTKSLREARDRFDYLKTNHSYWTFRLVKFTPEVIQEHNAQ